MNYSSYLEMVVTPDGRHLVEIDQIVHGKYSKYLLGVEKYTHK